MNLPTLTQCWLSGTTTAALWTEDYALPESVVARPREEAPRLERRLGLLYAEAMEAYLRFVRARDPSAIPALLGIAERGEAVPYVSQAARLRRDVARPMVAVGDTEGARGSCGWRTMYFSDSVLNWSYA